MEMIKDDPKMPHLKRSPIYRDPTYRGSTVLHICSSPKWRYNYRLSNNISGFEFQNIEVRMSSSISHQKIRSTQYPECMARDAEYMSQMWWYVYRILRVSQKEPTSFIRRKCLMCQIFWDIQVMYLWVRLLYLLYLVTG